MALGNSMQPGDWIEFETTSFPHYLTGHDSKLRNYGNEPQRVYLTGFDGSGVYASNTNMTQASAGRRKLGDHRRLSVPSITWNDEHKTAVIRIEGRPNCMDAKPWDPCGGNDGYVSVQYAPPPSPTTAIAAAPTAASTFSAEAVITAAITSSAACILGRAISDHSVCLSRQSHRKLLHPRPSRLAPVKPFSRTKQTRRPSPRSLP